MIQQYNSFVSREPWQLCVGTARWGWDPRQGFVCFWQLQPKKGSGQWEQAQSSPQGPGDATRSGRGAASLRPEVQLQTDIQILEIHLHWRWHVLGQGQGTWP